MNIKDLKSSLPYLFKAETTAFIWGHAGIGKSTVIRQFCEEKGYKFFPFYLGTMSDVGDVLGLATFVKDESGQDVATKFAEPNWLRDMIAYCNDNPDSGAVILLDEFNRARRDILNGMFSLALDKTFHTIKLPKNCHIIAAGNPPTDDYYVTDVNDTALMSRFVHIKLEPSFQEWTAYAKEKAFESTLVSFLQEQPELIEDHKSTFVNPVKVDRRSYERASRLFKVGTPKELLEQLLIGIIGVERLVAYKLHLTKTDKPLTGKQVLAGEGEELIKLWSNPVDVKSSLLSITADNVFEEIVNIATTNSDFPKNQADHFMVFIETVPKEVAFPILRKFINTYSGQPFFRNFTEDSAYRTRLIDLARGIEGIKKEKSLK